MPSPSVSSCNGFGMAGQLSATSQIPSPSASPVQTRSGITPSAAPAARCGSRRTIDVGGDAQPVESHRAIRVLGKKLLLGTAVEIFVVKGSLSWSTSAAVEIVVTGRPELAGSQLPEAVKAIAGTPCELKSKSAVAGVGRVRVNRNRGSTGSEDVNVPPSAQLQAFWATCIVPRV